MMSIPDSTRYKASDVRWPALEGLQLSQWDHCKPVRWLRYPPGSDEYRDNVQALLDEADAAQEAARQAAADAQGQATSEEVEDNHRIVLEGMSYAALQRKARALRQGLGVLAACDKAASVVQPEHLRVSIEVRNVG